MCCCFPRCTTKTPVLIRDEKIKWLGFGMAPDPQNLQPHPGFVWVKSGYSKAIAWRKVQLTKQRNVGTYFFNFPQSCSLCAFTGTRPVLRGAMCVCPNGFPALMERDNNGDDSDSE